MNFTATVAGGTLLGLEWDNPWNGVTGTVTDNVQMTIFDQTTGTFLNTTTPPANTQGETGGMANTIAIGEPFQSIFLPNDGTYTITAFIPNTVEGPGVSNPGFATATTPLPVAMQFILGNGANISSFQFVGADVSAYGHSAGPYTVGVAAVDSAAPTVSESFSSPGPSLYYFDSLGNRLATPLTVMNPFISAPDDMTTYVGNQFVGNGLDPFFGTGGAPPDGAGVADLFDSGEPTLTQAKIVSAFTATATRVNNHTAGSWDPQAGLGA